MLGYPEAWKHELPAVSTKQEGTSSKTTQTDDKMKIAWRYESLASRNAPSPAANGRYRDQARPFPTLKI